ncbi:MAG: hypothetical protein ACE5F6_17255 [Anaerolineae bacterium]
MAFGQRSSHIIKTKTGPDDPELLETLQEALGQANPEDLVTVADDLAERHARFADCLGEAKAIWSLTQDDLEWVARSVTVARRHATTLAEYLAQHNIAVVTHELLHGNNQPAVRIAGFAARLHGLDPRLRLELATGLLHYTFPANHWLWTRWLWDTTTRTGILPLLAGSVHNLLADDVAEGYVKVGHVAAMSMRFAEGTGLLTSELTEHPRRRPFAADVFLACAYSIYLYGVTSWRLSREFNRLLPTLPNMMRRLLGLPKLLES